MSVAEKAVTPNSDIITAVVARYYMLLQLCFSCRISLNNKVVPPFHQITVAVVSSEK
jgi:hypothetical protein